jgi:hypothetical protein
MEDARIVIENLKGMFQFAYVLEASLKRGPEGPSNAVDIP